jgi:type IV pilus assembly protein PilQ
VIGATAGAVTRASGPAALADAPAVQLTAITSQTSRNRTMVVIEASGPAAYIATRPDPLTLYVDFRHVSAEGVDNRFLSEVASPVADVRIEATELFGEPVSRVHITLAQAVGHRVRSDRNRVVIDFERPKAGVHPLPPAAARPDPIDALGHASLAAKPAVDPILQPAPAAREAVGVQAPTESAAQQAIGVPRTERRFTGNPVSLDFQGADLRAVLRTFSEISGLNIVIDPKVQGTVDVALRDVPWDQALDIILRGNGLSYSVDGTIVRIAPIAVLADEEAQRRKLAEEQALAGNLRVLTKTLSYAKADEELQGILTKTTLSPRGIVQIDKRTNTLIITDLPDRLQTASNLLDTLDTAQPQVEIEARIVQTSRTFARQLGIQWGFNGKVDPSLGNTTNLAFPNNGSLTGKVNLPAQGATSTATLALGSVNGAFNIDVALSALETSGNGRILSTPRVSTQNNVEAEITQGTQIPIQVVSNNTVTVTFKDAALSLKVVPQITAAGTVIMRIALENGTADFTRSVNGIPPIDTQRANTTVLVNNGQTTVIGGIYLTNQQVQNDRTPGLSTIPLLRWLFKHDQLNDSQTELLIFITPRIMK